MGFSFFKNQFTHLLSIADITILDNHVYLRFLSVLFL
jgi:hypothetical protein